MMALQEGDLIQKKYPGVTRRWKVVTVAVEDGRVRLESEHNGYRFWIDRQTADRYWLPDRVES